MGLTTPCLGCRRPVPVGTGGRCRDCMAPQRRLRSGRAWRLTSEMVRARGVCARCGTTTGPFEADHVTPLGHDLSALELQCLCRPCHAAKTAAERRT